MLYCPKCQVLCEDQCPLCGSRYLLDPQAEDPVRLATAENPQAGQLEQLLQARSIPYEKRAALSAGTQQAFNFYVPFCRSEEGKQAAAVVFPSTPTVSTPDAEQKDKADKPRTYRVKGEEFEVMPRKKRIFWRAFSVVLFLLLIFIVVFVTDQAAGWVKGLFS